LISIPKCKVLNSESGSRWGFGLGLGPDPRIEMNSQIKKVSRFKTLAFPFTPRYQPATVAASAFPWTPNQTACSSKPPTTRQASPTSTNTQAAAYSEWSTLALAAMPEMGN